MSTVTKPITAEEFMQMHFDVPVELVRGEIVYLSGEDGMTRPDQVHGGVCWKISFVIGKWAEMRNAGSPTTNDGGILTERGPDTVRGADVAFFPFDRLPDGKLQRRRPDIVPLLCVEVLSPSNSYAEIAAKRDEYLACGVEEVWIVDTDQRTVEVFRSDRPHLRFEECDVLTSHALPDFSCPVGEIFEHIE